MEDRFKEMKKTQARMADLIMKSTMLLFKNSKKYNADIVSKDKDVSVNKPFNKFIYNSN